MLKTKKKWGFAAEIPEASNNIQKTNEKQNPKEEKFFFSFYRKYKIMLQTNTEKQKY